MAVILVVAAVIVLFDAAIASDPNSGTGVRGRAKGVCAFNPCTLPSRSLPCHGRGRCRVSRSNCTTECRCVLGYSGQRCEKVDVGYGRDGRVPVTAAPPSAKYCLGLYCRNGVCDREAAAQSRVRCACESKNWTGELCDVWCPRDCGRGSCFVDWLGWPRCMCPPWLSPQSNCTQQRRPSSSFPEARSQ